MICSGLTEAGEEYNSKGLKTKAIDPVGWETVYEYDASGTNLLAMKQKNGAGHDLLWSASYAPVPVPPTTPTGLVAVAGAGAAHLFWTGAPGNTYTVKRGTTSGGPYDVVASGVAAPSHTDPGLTNGTTYYYVVSAVNAQGESGRSNEASTSPQARVERRSGARRRRLRAGQQATPAPWSWASGSRATWPGSSPGSGSSRRPPTPAPRGQPVVVRRAANDLRWRRPRPRARAFTAAAGGDDPVSVTWPLTG